MTTWQQKRWRKLAAALAGALASSLGSPTERDINRGQAAVHGFTRFTLEEKLTDLDIKVHLDLHQQF